MKNWWAGVETITTLFIKEHNYLCGQLRQVHIPLGPSNIPKTPLSLGDLPVSS